MKWLNGMSPIDAKRFHDLDRLTAMLHRDINYLDTSFESPLVDYSFFITFGPTNPNGPLEGCISEFVKGMSLCISIIDYLMKYGTFRHIENAVRGGKYDHYGKNMMKLWHSANDMMRGNWRSVPPAISPAYLDLLYQ